MISRRLVCLFSFVVFSVAPSFAHHMALVVNKGNSVADVSSVHLAKIFRLEVRKWHSGEDIVLVLHANSETERTTVERLCGRSGPELKALLAAHSDAIKLVDTDADVLKFVESNPGAVGLVDVRSITDQINVVKVDKKLPMEAGYLPH